MYTDEYYKMYEFENDYWWYRGLHELIRDYIQKLADTRTARAEPLHIFDAGCGTGRMMEILSPYGRVDGIDYSEDAIGLCQKRGLTQAQTGDLNTWTPPSQVYDVIISNDVICTSGVTDDMAVIKKFYDALKPQGFLILNLPAFMLLRRRHDIAVFGKRRYRKNQTIADLRKTGFEPIYAGYRLPHLFLIILAQKTLVEPFQKGDAVSDLKPLPAPLNSVMLLIHRMENTMIRAGVPLPFGSSLFLVCRKSWQAPNDPFNLLT